MRVVVDSTLRTPPDAAVLSNGAASGTVLAVTEGSAARRREEAPLSGRHRPVLPSDADDRVDLVALLGELVAFGIGSVMVEGGLP